MTTRIFSNSKTSRLLGWLGTPLYLLAFGVIVLVFDPCLRLIHLVFGYEAHQKGIHLMNRLLYGALWLNACRISWNRHPHALSIPASTSGTAQHPMTRIFIANHQSLNDIPPLIWKLRSFRLVLVSKAELSQGIPSVSYNFKAGGVIAIQRQNPQQSLEAMRKLGERIARSGENVLYFPEGTRARDGKSAVFRSGGLEQLMQSNPQVELVPVAIRDSWRLAQWNFLPIPFGQTIRFDILPSILSNDVLQQCDGHVGKAARLLMQSAQEAIVQQLNLEIL
ncbi:MAG: 1-acyl-sn-glycerol-3-phosphate acyltransferase [Sphingomonadales bacterium]|nr:1-acyl-sn-glycerol-3-phosphate acyltransferase [Sphingomonadales bacterium]MBM3924042.1 1-acyl-sn-glycerol-3-phosphate acyltransferase [Sphingomonadales bacterium]MBM3932156.1 1-acyl-sn-glycerol-3-phosphate acyltransferase [Sphingomonadales bacterium]